MPATGTKQGPGIRRSPRARAGIVVGGAAALSAVAVGVGLWAASGTPDEPYPDDVYASAPGCDLVPAEGVQELLPEALHETDTTGPRSGGAESTCTWTAQDQDTGGVLRVGLSVRFTDPSGESLADGDERTAAFFGHLVPEHGEEVDLPGGPAQVWTGHTPGTVELAQHTDNLLVRVSYAGPPEQDTAEAEDGVVELATLLGEAL